MTKGKLGGIIYIVYICLMSFCRSGTEAIQVYQYQLLHILLRITTRERKVSLKHRNGQITKEQK